MSIKKKIKFYFEDKFGLDIAHFYLQGSKYTIAQIITASFSVLSIPILTRLLSTSDYGIFSIFNASLAIFSVVFGFQMYGAVGRYYLEKKKDFYEFLGNTLIILALIFLIEGTIFYFFKTSIFSFLKIPELLFFYLLIVVVLTILYSIYTNLLVCSFESTEYTILVSVMSFLTLGFSILFILSRHSNKYLGRIEGQIIVLALTAAYICYKLFPKITWKLKWQYIKYSLNYNIPAIPGALSGFILAYADRVIINQITTSSKAGLYSLSWNVCYVVQLIIGGFNGYWSPKFINDMNDKNYSRINLLLERFIDIVIYLSLGMALFSKDIINFLTPVQYHEAAFIIPYLLLGYYFQYIASTFGGFTSYYKKHILTISINLIIIGILNVALNYLLIPKYGYGAAAFATLISYFFYAVLNYLTIRYLLNTHIIKIRIFFIKLFPALLLFIIIYLLKFLFAANSILIIIKVVALALWGLWLYHNQTVYKLNSK